MLDRFLQDFRFGCRLWYREARAAAAIVLILALGMGPNITLFSMVNKLLIKPVDIADYDRFGVVRQGDLLEPDEHGHPILGYPAYERIRAATPSVEHMVGWSGSKSAVQMGNQPAFYARIDAVTGNFFEAVGRDAVLGETFKSDPMAAPGSVPYLVLSHRFWQKTLKSDPQIVGKTMSVNRNTFTIIGVMPKSFNGIISVLAPDMWTPMMMIPQLRPDDAERLTEKGDRWMTTVVKLKPGVNRNMVNAELEAAAQMLSQSDPETYENLMLTCDKFDNLAGMAPPEVNMITGGLFLLVGLILLVACSSVGSLLLSRATERRSEIAVRLAVGASRGRVIQQLLTESAMLAALAGLLSLVLTMWTLYLIHQFAPPAIAYTISISDLDLNTMLFTVAASLATTVLFGLAPALQATRGELLPALKDQPGGLGSEYQVSRRRGFFTAAQFTVSVALLVVAGLGVRGLRNAGSLDPGFHTENLLVLTINPTKFGYTRDEMTQFIDEFRESLASNPDSAAVSVSRLGPLANHRTATRASILNDDLEAGPQHRIFYNYVNPDFFNVSGIDIIEGRAFTGEDDAELAPACIVNQTFVDKFFEGREPLGAHISSIGVDALRVVGVAQNSKYFQLGEEPLPYVYFPLNRRFSHEATFMIRTTTPNAQALPAVRKAVGQAFPELILEDMVTIEKRVENAMVLPKVIAMVLSGLGFLALLLGMTGAYGVVSYSIRLRAPEVGVRLALGAPPRELILMLIKGGMTLILTGTIFGLILGGALANLLKPILTGVSIYDPLAYLAPSLLLLVVGASALYLPARRTANAEPSHALRYE